MLPDRVSNPGPDLRVRCPTDCAARPGVVNCNKSLCSSFQQFSDKIDASLSRVRETLFDVICFDDDVSSSKRATKH